MVADARWRDQRSFCAKELVAEKIICKKMDFRWFCSRQPRCLKFQQDDDLMHLPLQLPLLLLLIVDGGFHLFNATLFEF